MSREGGNDPAAAGIVTLGGRGMNADGVEREGSASAEPLSSESRLGRSLALPVFALAVRYHIGFGLLAACEPDGPFARLVGCGKPRGQGTRHPMTLFFSSPRLW